MSGQPGCNGKGSSLRPAWTQADEDKVTKNPHTEVGGAHGLAYAMFKAACRCSKLNDGAPVTCVINRSDMKLAMNLWHCIPDGSVIMDPLPDENSDTLVVLVFSRRPDGVSVVADADGN